MTTDRTWHRARHQGGADALHARPVPDDGRRHLWTLTADAPAVVLGSTQADDTVDADAARAAGVAVVRRRSGGGAVWVDAATIWVDVVIPAGDPLWAADVGRAFGPVGAAWRHALDEVGVGLGTLQVHEGAMVQTRWSRLVCFAGAGPGEVLAGTSKVVGISQRRTRAAARFQCALYRRWDPTALCALLAAGPEPGALASAGVGIGDEVDTAELIDALVDALGEHALD